MLRLGLVVWRCFFPPEEPEMMAFCQGSRMRGGRAEATRAEGMTVMRGVMQDVMAPRGAMSARGVRFWTLHSRAGRSPSPPRRTKFESSEPPATSRPIFLATATKDSWTLSRLSTAGARRPCRRTAGANPSEVIRTYCQLHGTQRSGKHTASRRVCWGALPAAPFSFLLGGAHFCFRHVRDQR